MSMFKLSKDDKAKILAGNVKHTARTTRDIPIVFLSLDEPNADANWKTLQLTTPHQEVQRVHGVKGFDACHKAAAQAFPNAGYVITVDADSIVDPAFFELRLPKGIGFMSYTWGGRQFTNGLMYGNGGLKLWNTEHLMSMKSHEASNTERDEVDFCWDESQYKELPGCYSTVYTNASPYQAFRVGFREGVKLSTEAGKVINKDNIKEIMHAANYQRLLTWLTVGADVKNGIWSIIGARTAIRQLYFNNFDYTLIRDYEWFNEYFKSFETITERGMKELQDAVNEVYGFNLPILDESASLLFKQLQLHPEKPLTYDDVHWRTNLKLFGWWQ